MALTPSPEGIRDVLLAAGIEVTPGTPRLLTGGASREVWSIDARDARGALVPLILRRDPPGHGDAVRMRAEAACLRAAAAAGVPVPSVLAEGDTAPGIDAPFLLMNRVPGEALPRRIQRDPVFADVRPGLAEEMGYVLGLVHRSDITTLDTLDRTDPVDVIEALYRDLDAPRPAVELGLRWLRAHRPPARPTALVHGDFRLGNLLVDPDGIRGVLDWELAHLGDPIEDLGWLCVRAWRFGAPDPVAGLGSREQLLDGYFRATGVRPGADELHWWETFGTLKWLVVSAFQAHRHFGGSEPSLELAAIGRRICESEFDLLLILGLLDEAPAARPRPPRPTLHDRPTPAEILDLVAATLTDDIAPAVADGHDRERYLLRICVNLLHTATRELAVDRADDDHLTGLLDALGRADEADLAHRLRTGDADAADPAVRRAVSAAVLARLRVANPRHLPRRPV
ncbi:phosphotransferase family protein [Nocardia thailandica]